MPVFVFKYHKTVDSIPEVCVTEQHHAFIGFRTYYTNEVYGIGHVHLVASVQGCSLLDAFRMMLGADGVQLYSLQKGKLSDVSKAIMLSQYRRTEYQVYDGDSNFVGHNDEVRPVEKNGVIVFKEIK